MCENMLNIENLCNFFGIFTTFVEVKISSYDYSELNKSS